MSSHSHVIPSAESLTVEFKSDRGPLHDKELIETVVCLANTSGGVIYLGVEDNGEVTGLHPKHNNPNAIAALVGNRTVPSVSVHVELIEHEAIIVAAIHVPQSPRLVATSEGNIKRRQLKADGTPECVPFLPHEFVTRESDLRAIDYVSLPVAGASLSDLDPVERDRLRRIAERYGGDSSLATLDDEELDGALGLVRREGTERRPTVLGLLLLGKESSLREHLPTHEVAFQVLDGEQVLVNEFKRAPLLRVFEWLESVFEARYVEKEVQVGLFRVGVPNVDRRSFREAVANALTHRDYTRLGAVHLRWEREHLCLSNPGGFVEGVTLDNLLTVEPRPRNPALADVFKRLGLVERTGRGVDLIYRGLLRYGRPAPDYSRTTSSSVVLRMSTAEPDFQFVEMVVGEENRSQAPLPIDALIVLALLRNERRVDARQIAGAIQKDIAAARKTLEHLAERGFLARFGETKGRTYTLSASVYREKGQGNAYVRQAGFEAIQQEQMVRNLVETQGEVRRGDVMDLCRIGGVQATRLLQRLVDEGVLLRLGKQRGAYYVLGPEL